MLADLFISLDFHFRFVSQVDLAVNKGWPLFDVCPVHALPADQSPLKLLPFLLSSFLD